MFPLRRLLFIVIAAAAVCGRSLTLQAQPAIPVLDKITVDISFRTPVPEPLRLQIVDSVENVGKKALQGKTVEEAESLKASLAQVMKKIFTEVLSGFKVHDLSVRIGPPVLITVDLEAEQQQVD